MAILFAATYPERARGAGPLRRLREAGSIPTTTTPGRRRGEARARLHRGSGARLGLRVRHEAHVPVGRRGDGALVGRACRAAASPGAIRALDRDELADRRPRGAAGDPRPDARRAPRHRLRRARRGGPLHRRADPRRALRRAAREPITSSAIDPDQILDVVEPFLAERAAPLPAPTASWRRCSSPTSSVDRDGRRARRPRWRDCSSATTRSCAASSAGSAAASSRRSGDGILARSTAPPGPSAAPTRSSDALAPLGHRRPRRRAHGRGRGRTGDRVRGVAIEIARPRRRRGRARRGARVPDRRATSSPAPASSSPTAAAGRSPASPANGACWRSSTWPGSSLWRS